MGLEVSRPAARDAGARVLRAGDFLRIPGLWGAAGRFARGGSGRLDGPAAWDFCEIFVTQLARSSGTWIYK